MRICGGSAPIEPRKGRRLPTPIDWLIETEGDGLLLSIGGQRVYLHSELSKGLLRHLAEWADEETGLIPYHKDLRPAE